jgi:hypothetical protein
MTTLYAWATPAFTSGSPVDHTWVTDYDNRVNPYATIGDVTAANSNYWYCWGTFHIQGSSTVLPDGYLGSAAGSLGWASCLCTPNNASNVDPSARGTIYTYGIDGVCHQLANQILWATSGPGIAPLTVSKAAGYAVSSFIYGAYGLQHAAWAARKAHCASPGSPVTAWNVTDEIAPDDDFAAHAQVVLASMDAAHKVAPLRELREQVHIEQHALKSTLASGIWTPSADALNERNNAYLASAKSLLTAAEFEAVFGFPPDQTIELVDSSILTQGPGSI